MTARRGGTGSDFASFINRKELPMDRHDEELLDRQVRRIAPPSANTRVMMAAIVAIFLAGMTLGGFLFAPKKEPMRTASNDATSTLSFFLSGAPPIAR